MPLLRDAVLLPRLKTLEFCMDFECTYVTEVRPRLKEFIVAPESMLATIHVRCGQRWNNWTFESFRRVAGRLVVDIS